MKMIPEKTAALGKRVFLMCLMASAALVLAGCATQVVVPPVATPATGERHDGKFVWFDLFTSDVAATSAFYSSLFGWEMVQTDPDKDDVVTIRRNGCSIGNIVARKSNAAHSQWLAYMSVPDVDGAVDFAVNNGGLIHIPPKDFPDRGRFAVVVDAQGASVAVLSSSSGDPVDAPFVDNDWMGAELWTHDVDKAITFYSHLGGYTVSQKTDHDTVLYTLFSSEERPRAGVSRLPWTDFKPEWIPYVGVKDIQATLATALKLGAKVHVSPNMHSKHGRVAVITDVSGAVFGVQQLR